VVEDAVELRRRIHQRPETGLDLPQRQAVNRTGSPRTVVGRARLPSGRGLRWSRYRKLGMRRRWMAGSLLTR
jgi:hypothetical protein